MENLQCVSCVIIEVGHHKKGVDERVCRSARVWAGQRQEVQGRSYLRQCSLCQGNRRTATRAKLFGGMEGWPGRRKYLRTFLGSHVPLEDGQHLPQESSAKADSDISTPGLPFAHGQANNPAPCKAKTRVTNKTY